MKKALDDLADAFDAAMKDLREAHTQINKLHSELMEALKKIDDLEKLLSDERFARHWAERNR